MKGASKPLRFRQALCRAEGCGEVFYVCSRCDRGQVYCSVHCREESRRRRHREANRRYQRSPEGRLDHRARQVVYRKQQADRRRYAEKSVTDHSSPTPTVHASMGATELIPRAAAAARLAACPRPNWVRRRANPVQCRFCGCSGHFVNPFYTPG
jgi:hypothetical protein